MSLKLGLSGKIKPDLFDREREQNCILCSQTIPIGLPRSSLCEDCLHVIEANNGLTYFHLYRASSQPWLVKSGGLVLGPLSTAQVEEKIRHKEIGLFDYVQRPYGRWLYAREEETFKSVVEEVRSRPSSREDTVALTHTEITEVMDPSKFSEDTMSGARTVEALEMPQADNINIENYGVESQPSNTFRNVMFFGFLFFLVILAFSIVTFNSSPQLTDDQYRKVIQEANENFQAGDYDAARLSYRKASGSKEIDTQNALNYAALLISQNLLTEADQIFARLAGRGLSRDEETQINVLKGLKSLTGGDTKAAEEATKLALEIDRTSENAIFNMANIHLIKGEPERALETLEIVESPKADWGLWRALLAVAASARANLKGNVEGLQRIVDKISSPTVPGPYVAETHLLLAYLNFKLQKNNEVVAEVETLLRSEPEITESSVKNLWLYQKQISWASLETYCYDIKQGLSDQRLGEALWTYCQIQVGEVAKAKQIAQDLFLKKETDPMARSLLAYAELKLGKHDQAQTLLKNQPLGSPLEHWVMYSSCQALGDDECLREQLSKLVEITPNSPFGLTEMVKLNIKKKDKAETERWLESARDKASYYQPLRQLDLMQKRL